MEFALIVTLHLQPAVLYCDFVALTHAFTRRLASTTQSLFLVISIMKSALFVSSIAVGSALTGPLDSYLKDSVPYASTRIENAINTDSGVGGTNVATKDNIAGNNEAALSTGG
jgi:hypothetical protein